MTDRQANSDRGGEVRAEEVWTFAGRRALHGKRYYAWRDNSGQGLYYAKVKAITIGGRYTLTVARHGDTISVYGEARYTGDHIDDALSRDMEARDIAAEALLAARARDRNDARHKALDDALEPLIVIAAKLRFGHERDALLAHLIRRLTSHW